MAANASQYYDIIPSQDHAIMKNLSEIVNLDCSDPSVNQNKYY